MAPIGGPNQGTLAAGSAPANASAIARCAPPHHSRRASPPIDRPATRCSSIGSRAALDDPLGLDREHLGLDHGHPAQVVEVRQVADLVAHRPALCGRGKVPLRCVVGQRVDQTPGILVLGLEIDEEVVKGAHRREVRRAAENLLLITGPFVGAYVLAPLRRRVQRPSSIQ